MTDRPIREPIPPHRGRDRSIDEPAPVDEAEPPPDASTTRPSSPEEFEPDGGERPPTPSQAEGERETR